MAKRKLIVEVVGDADSFERAMRRSGKVADDSNKKLRTLGRAAGIAGFALGGVLAVAAKEAFGELADAQKVTAQTRAVLKSTGKQANVTGRQVEKLAGTLSDLSGVDDELIQSSENVLLTFTNVRDGVKKSDKIFTRATGLILDMSVALDKDLQSSAIQVGKALNDPIKGVSALQRAGVSFTKAQRDEIKALVDTGRTLDAQKLILRELNKEFGGSAKAAGETLPGKLNKLKNTLLNLGAEIADKFTPAITKLVDKIVNWIQKSENQQKIMRAVEDASRTLRSVFNTLRSAMEKLNAITGSTSNSVKLLFGALLAYKGLKLANTLKTMADNFGLIGTQAGASVGKVKTLRGLLVSLGKIGVITIGIELLINKTPIDSWLRKHGLGFLTKGLLENLGSLGGGGSAKKPPRRTGTGGGGFGSGGRGPNSLSGGRSGAGTVNNFNGDIHVDGVKNPREFLNELQKEAKRRSPTTRGPGAGSALGFG